MELAPAARPARAAHATRTAAPRDIASPDGDPFLPSTAVTDAPSAPPDSNAADDKENDTDLTAIEERLAAIQARVGRTVGDTVGDPVLAQTQADFDRAMAWQAELLRETNVLVAMWTDQRKKEDELLTKEIEMIG